MGRGASGSFLKLTVEELPYDAVPCISGLRVFGLREGKLPEIVGNVTVTLDGDLDMDISWETNEHRGKAEGDKKAETGSPVVGYNILWGHAPDKLYHSCMVFDTQNKRIGALVKGQPVYVRVDAFNEVGIREGEVVEVRK